MARTIATEPPSPFRLSDACGGQRADNDITFAVTSVAAPLEAAAGAARGAGTPLAALLRRASAALESDAAAAREWLAAAIEMLEPGLPAAGPARPAACAARPARGGLARWQVDRIAAFVEANIGTAIRAGDLAALVRLSASHFFHAFKDSFGETPLAYVARRRMAHAQQLMRTTDEPLAQIALACGLCDQSHFTRVFRRVVGTSPHAWRRQHAGGPMEVAAGLCATTHH